MEVKGLLKEDEMYCSFWNQRTNSDVLLTDRSPLVDTSEHCIRKRVDSEEMREWYQYLWSGYVNSVWDDAVVNLSDSDYDGDICMTTDNPIMINAVRENNPPVTYGKRKAPNQKLTQHYLIKNDVLGFGSQIGQITNVASSMFCKQAMFERDSEEWKELDKRLKLMRKRQRRAN